MQKQVQFKTRGMNRDLSESAFNPEFSYENKNMRIMPTNDNTLFSLVNEKGNRYEEINGLTNIQGTPIGQAVINNELIVFTTNAIDKDKNVEITSPALEIKDINARTIEITEKLAALDKIYKLWLDKGKLYGKTLFSGDLDFDYKNPIETLTFYENDDIKKVYWTDGLNQPRVINTQASLEDRKKWNDNSFNFVRRLSLREKIIITRDIVSNGVFAPGVIQYAFTYFNKYGQESNIFYTSPLFYISYNNRGASPEDTVSNSFNIKINTLDKSFDYLRIYSIQRTSEDSIPEVKKVVDISTDTPTGDSKHLVSIYIDNGTSGEVVDPTELLYKGGEEVIFGTMTQKDNTLFLGDIKLNRKTFDEEIINFFRGEDARFQLSDKSIESPKPVGFYPYNNQLKLSSNQFKTFKYLETYRLGIQFQHYTGKWSEPIWINDVRNETHAQTEYTRQSNVFLPIAKYTLKNTDILSSIVYKYGYLRARPVIVYPSMSDRECICQGILCPTVYNVEDRFGNSPFVQSSWFTRPNLQYDIKDTLEHPNSDDRTIEGKLNSANSKSGVVASFGPVYHMNMGLWSEFRNNFPIPDNKDRRAEIQCIVNPPADPILSNLNETTSSKWVTDNAENFYIDQSILTFHSPDIEFSNEIRSIDSSNLKLRIVGIVPLTSFVGDIDIQTSTPPNIFKNSTESAEGFYKEPIRAENISRQGCKGIISGPYWMDEIFGRKDDNKDKKHTGFVVYPWHRNGSLNNTKSNDENGYKSAKLSIKRISNMRYSYNSFYLDSSWEPNNGVSGVSIFDSNEKSLIRIPSPKNSKLPDMNYYGNVDRVINISRVGEDKKDGYPIITSLNNITFNKSPHDIFIGEYQEISTDISDTTKGLDPVRIKYKSTPHAVIALNYTTDGRQVVLPTITEGDSELDSKVINYTGKILKEGENYFWDSNKSISGVSQDTINFNFSKYNNAFKGTGPEYGFLWLAELYTDNIPNRFGGNTQEALENNLWLPCGEPVELTSEKGLIKQEVNIEWTEGDTYYQRYDHIKTYPFTLEDQNEITDIVSFMCETRVNLDGRYDRNRGQTSNLAINPSNFNQLNKVYSQYNNFFNYRSLNTNKLNLDNFHNSITWTKTKTAGELIDTWTNITLASTLDLDGDKGNVRALKRFNNSIIAFQDTGISQILYNENVQIQSTEGVPIEIANSGKVQGKRYITDKLGCSNKWSICETPNGLYFIDDISKGIYLFNSQINNISDKYGFHSWVNSNTKGINIWNPVDFNGFVTYYDKVNKDVFFITEKECLAFSETLGNFSSFYSYEHTPYFANLENKGIAFNKKGGEKIYKAWIHNEGKYNMFFDRYQPFYTKVVVNPEMPKDKIFNNLEFRADTWENNLLINDTFDLLRVKNEYQEGESKLENIRNKPSTLKKKFRIWGANIPRNIGTRDRIRNPWIYLKLSKEKPNTNKTILHDMVVSYFD